MMIQDADDILIIESVGTRMYKAIIVANQQGMRRCAVAWMVINRESVYCPMTAVTIDNRSAITG